MPDFAHMVKKHPRNIPGDAVFILSPWIEQDIRTWIDRNRQSVYPGYRYLFSCRVDYEHRKLRSCRYSDAAVVVHRYEDPLIEIVVHHRLIWPVILTADVVFLLLLVIEHVSNCFCKFDTDELPEQFIQ